jgi:hypothetical protein
MSPMTAPRSTCGGDDDGSDVGSGLQRVASGADPVGRMLGDEPGERARRAGARFRRLHRGNDCVFVRPSAGHSRDHQPAATGVEGGPGDSRKVAGTALEICHEGIEAIRVDPVDCDVEAATASPHLPGAALAGRRAPQDPERLGGSADQSGRRVQAGEPRGSDAGWREPQRPLVAVRRGARDQRHHRSGHRMRLRAARKPLKVTAGSSRRNGAVFICGYSPIEIGTSLPNGNNGRANRTT